MADTLNRPPLSPAAQAALDAFLCDCEISLKAGLAAALRAAADQGEYLYDQHEGKVSVIRTDKLFTIAAELEAQP
jgi:hypothetical protein